MPGIPYIQIRNVSKVFPPSVLALDHVSIDIFKGEIHSPIMAESKKVKCFFISKILK